MEIILDPITDEAKLTPLIMAMVVLGITWFAVALRYFGLIGGCLAVLLASICLGHPFFHQSIGPIPLTIDRLLLIVVFAIYLAARKTSFVDEKPMSKADVPMILFLGYLVISTLSHDWAYDDNQPLATLLFFYLVPAVMYWLARDSKIDASEYRSITSFWLVLGLYLSFIAIAEVMQFHALVLPRFIVSPDHSEFFGRARGPLLNPIGNGLVLTCSLAAAISLFCGEVRSSGVWAARGAAILLFLVGIYLTLTRSVWLGAGLGATLIASQVTPRRHRRRFVFVVCLFSALVVIAKKDSLVAFKRDKEVSVSEMADSARLRPILAAVAWKMFWSHPISGVGYGQYKQHDEQYLAQRDIDLPLQKARPYIQHNVFLSLLTETGLLGLTLFALLLVSMVRDAWLLSRDQLCFVRQQGLLSLMFLVAYVVNGMFHEVAIIPAVNAVLFTLAGINRGLMARLSAPARGHYPAVASAAICSPSAT